MATHLAPDDLEAEERKSQSVVTLLRRLTHELSTLLRQEIRLAGIEIGGALKKAIAGLLATAGGGAVLFAGVLVLLAAAVLGLATVLQPWLAALIVGAAVSLIGVILVVSGAKRLKLSSLEPERSVRSLSKDKDVLMRREP
jgi:xanthine/uracil permease